MVILAVVQLDHSTIVDSYGEGEVCWNRVYVGGGLASSGAWLQVGNYGNGNGNGGIAGIERLDGEKHAYACAEYVKSIGAS